MAQFVIATDLNRCVGCLACSVSCKVANGVNVGDFWLKVLRIGPNPIAGGSGQWPDVEHYYLPVQCQHCADPECVKVCPTGASHKLEDGTVQIDKSTRTGCPFCARACPYGVRDLTEEERVVATCTLCDQKLAPDELPPCVAQCSARARFFGDIEKGVGTFEAPWVVPVTGGDVSYEKQSKTRITLEECVQPFSESDVHHLPNAGNDPSFVYILRDRTWQGGGE